MNRLLPIVLSVACLLPGCGRKAPPKIDAETEARIKQEQKQARLDELIRKGKAQLDEDRFELAVATLTDARALDPDNGDAAKWLKKAETSLKEHRHEQHRKFQKAGEEALAARKYDDAIRELTKARELAQTLAIEDAILLDLLQKARKGRDARIAEDYKLAMDAGLAALSKQNYQGAFNAYTEALRLKPGDKPAQDGLQAARVELDRIAAEAKRKQDFERAMTLARDAMKANKHSEAVKHFAEARKLFPTDSDAEQGYKRALARRQEDYDLVMGAGKAALDKQNYQGALTSFNEALRLIPDDEDAKIGVRKAQDALDRIVGETKKKQDFDKLMVQARDAMKMQKHSEAFKLFEAALKLFPDDPDAKKLFVRARDLRQEDFQLAMDSGRNALKDQKYQNAVNAYKEAVRLIPEDKGAQVGLQTAQDALARIAADAKKKQDFDALILQARGATTAKKHAAAVKFYEDALKLFPTDSVASKELDAARKAAVEVALVEAEMLKREREYLNALNAGKAALLAKKYDEADKAYKTALAIKPNDKDALAGLNAIAADKKKKVDFDQQMTLAREATTAKKHTEAVKHYQQALNLFPNDPDAKKGLDAAIKAEGIGKKQNLEDYKLAMDAARDAVKKQNYQGAVFSFKEALRLMPGDKAAQEGLAAAEAALKTATDNAKNKQAFNQLMTQGKSALATKRYAEAAGHFQAALKLFPNDAEARKGLTDAQQLPMQEYTRLMQAGKTAALGKNFAEAIRLYTEALKIKPNDPEATAAIVRARQNKP